MKRLIISLYVLCCGFSSIAQEVMYQRPPAIIEKMALAPLSPVCMISDNNQWILRLDRPRYRPVAKLAQPELKLAGIRINPITFSGSRMNEYNGASLMRLSGSKEIPITGLPTEAAILSSSFSPNARQIVLAVNESKGVYLYRVDPETCSARRISDRRMNVTTRAYIEWINDDEFITLLVPSSIGEVPKKSEIPYGPVVQESTGKAAPARTFQDMLRNPYDESLFSYYFTAQMARVSGQVVKELGQPAIYSGLSISPDKKMLLVSTIQKPFSYQVPMFNFAQSYAVWDLNGKELVRLANNPTVIVPMGYDACSPYPRAFGWRADKPATVFWIEAQDEGDSRNKGMEYKDVAYQWSSPFNTPKSEVVRTKERLANIYWRDDNFALLREFSEERNNIKIWKFKPSVTGELQLIFDYSMDDGYGNPGNPVFEKNQYGESVVYSDKSGNEILMQARGASPDGDMPYISRYQIKEKKNSILWRCEAPYYESIEKVIDPVKQTVITSRQSKLEPANLFYRDLRKRKSSQLTYFTHPYPEMKGVTKEKIHYKRADGLDLTATVYLPAGYDKARDGRLPVLMWAYPREFRKKTDAAQVRGSQYTFTNIGNGSPVFWVMRGFCVMENVEMPIVSVSEDAEPNDSFLDQLIMNAEAAVNAIDRMGVGDRNRVAIGGHSYGAFMTANLMTHTKLFKAGIARSGAYNRTLTPFGFQSETRTYWEAPEVYYSMSPFSFANQLNGALLLIHGDMDNNTGTYPMQTERFFQALKGHGAIARFVSLPYESHGYTARENVLHLLQECDAWLDKYVKNAF